MKIYLIRHGETTGDLENRYGGDYDDELSEMGIEQSKELAIKLKNKSIQKIFHSPKIRAKQTTEEVNNILNISVQKITDIKERNGYGILTGMKKDEAEQKYPEEVKKLKEQPNYHNVTSSEPYAEFKPRILNAFKKITENEYDTIAIITHGGPIRCILRELLGGTELKKLGDCAIIEIEKTDEDIKLKDMAGAEK